MAEENSTMQLEELNKALTAATQERDSFKAELATLKGSTDAALGQVTAFKTALVDVHRSSMLKGLIDPDVAGLAPALDVDATGKVTEDSRKALEAWKASKSHFFKPAEGTRTEVVANPLVKPTPPSTPAVDAAGNQLSWEYWDKLKKDNPAEYARRQPELIQWAKTMERATGH